MAEHSPYLSDWKYSVEYETKPRVHQYLAGEADNAGTVGVSAQMEAMNQSLTKINGP
ncbi:uncharacterized protein BP01DRAFT_12101 [Aspergillus saccharolyticus JOP 1030-1]|uniref:Uncharacterized protein n=1 Tax=Aspergillus saccharolyticus JOP 1030-1 TaxID=1450539 RepID=A0A319A0F5_9EURO|nr:hypothetical protein BP01DRAFT_12101 [Aspergillus saccharolyticus JOP 1030-1]PYH50000.1 hypothetical protein BP01DRAFT_12101 [Aspergillus saccharolyticus JOP 1030-1]